MTKTKLALLGVGDVAQRDYLPEFHRLADRAAIVAACGRTASRLQAVADQYNIPNRYTDYTQMLAETDAEAVINLTPIQTHLATTLAALEAGKHVYTEKPVASTVADADRIRRTAQAHGLTIVCAPCVMLFPQVKYAQALLAEGAIGPVYAARGHAHMGVPPWSGFPSDPSPYFAKGAGPALDMGVYPLHALTGLLGPVKRVTAMVEQALHEFTVGDGPFAGKRVPVEAPDNWHLVLDFGNGRLASLTTNSCVQDSLAPPLELYGLQGTIALDPIYVHKPVDVLRPGGNWEKVVLPQTGRARGPDHHLGIEHLVDCIQHKTKPILSIDHALHVVEILEQAAASSREGRTMTMSSTF
ncbi:MAG: gfo/Idh/MocA family oxidoreductase [Caldilinea sp. CFX5]|nr:gfo/Idh/MocA family oxidoreductase [Caldilinea sp. CFX5]